MQHHMLSVTEGSFRFEYVHHFGRCTTVRQQQHLQTYYDLEAIAKVGGHHYYQVGGHRY